MLVIGDNIQTGVHVAKECQMIDPDQAIIEVIVDEATRYEAAKLIYQMISEGKAHVSIAQTMYVMH